MGIKFENCSAIGNGGHGFSFAGTTDAELINCIALDNGGEGFNVDGTSALIADMKSAAAAGETKDGLVKRFAERAKTFGIILGAIATSVDSAHKLVETVAKMIEHGP